MPVTLDILRAWRDPRGVIRAKLGAGVREDRALAVLMGGLALSFVAQWPVLARQAYFAPEIPLEARLTGALMGTVFLGPLIAYAVAAFSHLAARLVGGGGTFFAARLALFWAILASGPAILLNGLVQGFLGQGRPALVVGFVVLAGFVYLWINMLIEAER
jgi:hypothetical protein